MLPEKAELKRNNKLKLIKKSGEIGIKPKLKLLEKIIINSTVN